jgi:hypothetical protein
VDAYGGRLVFSSEELRFASLSLLEREYSGADLAAIHKPVDFPERRNFDISNLKSILAKMSGIVATPIVSKTFVLPATSPRTRAVSAPMCIIAQLSAKTNPQNSPAIRFRHRACNISPTAQDAQ